jgi:Ca2+-transporting ATPase
MDRTDWYKLKAEEVLELLGSSQEGLSSQDAEKRLQEQGENVIPLKGQRSWLTILFAQFSDFMIIVLIIAAIVSSIVGELQDALVILFIVVFNAIIGTVQAFRAERAVAALRKMSAPKAQVIRDKNHVTVEASQLVSGDIVVLELGNIVAADIRLIESDKLLADESSLTGESLPIDKHANQLNLSDLPISERENIVFKSSLITRGTAKGVVVGTGINTEIGRIAQLLQEEPRVKTPLQERLNRFGRYLAVAVLLICVVIFGVGLLQGQPFLLMLLTAISLAVAAIPEALPAVVTISLALGARKLILHHALVRNLPAVETLGSVSYICTDKTGTLTQNRMNVELFYAAGQRYDSLPAELSYLGQALALNNDVAQKDGKAAGEATELALHQAAGEAGFVKASLEQTMPRLTTIPFDSERKQMTTLHKGPEGVVAFVKGAPEKILRQCVAGNEKNGAAVFEQESVLEQVEILANEGYRVLAVAMRKFKEQPASPTADEIENNLTFLGLVALIDPPRPEAEQAVADCQRAGITAVMITGDHPGTAMAIAKRLGIASNKQQMLTGKALSNLSATEFSKVVTSLKVYARVSPEQKLQIVKSLQAKGEFVAMTGDGVNDAPALKRANIGVAMGQNGTDVAREASDMVLLDDNFATIVGAVQAGRRIFDNIRKFIKDTMSSNSGEIWTLFLAPFLALPIPLLPIHILWINLLTDGLPGLAFSAEPAEPNIMQRAPRPAQENIFSHGMWQHIIWVGLLVAGISLASMAWAISRGVDYWQTIVFTVLTLSQLFHSLAVRGESASLFTMGLLSNLPMLGAVILMFLLQMAVIYLPALNSVFHTQPLPMFDLAVCIGLSSLVLFAVEFEKWLVRAGWLYNSQKCK